jgi:parvulin-like peptidyl-prolyl isomerase
VPRPLVPERQGRRTGWLALFGAQRLVVAVSVLAVLAALGLLLFAWWDQNIRPRTELAIRVGDRSYDMEYWARRFKMAYDDPLNANEASRGFTSILQEKTSTAIETEAVLFQRADALGVSAGQNEIDREMLIRSNLGVVTDTPEGQEAGPDDPLRIMPGMASAIRAQLQRYGLTLAQYRETIHGQLLRDKVERHFVDQQPARGPQARVRLLQLPNESDARIAIQKITSGESTFAELANTVSLDQLGRGVGGERDWLPRGILPKPVEDAAFSLPLNTLSEPIDSGLPNGWFLVEVLERTEERDISEAVRKQLGQKAMESWLDEQRRELGVTNRVTVEDALWADEFLDIRGSGLGANLPTLPQPATQPVVPGAAPVPAPVVPDSAPAAPPAAEPPPPPPASSP